MFYQVIFNLPLGGRLHSGKLAPTPQKGHITLTRVIVVGIMVLHILIMQKRGDTNGVRLSTSDHVMDVADFTRASTRDDRDRDRVGDTLGQLEVEAHSRALSIYRRQKDFSGSELCHPDGPLKNVNSGFLAAIVGVGFIGTIGLFLGLN
jgi:hypothetical protein